ncbi:MAG: class I SAM-dependent methyltransferase [Alphaproteobacteria bacterium]|uniref:Class I SAM-dependent methyltransferase n=1 Tax=Candidatus Nitrobium versatile TaxID=2884831 RepID=A0A953JA69_9BACT|nr:class I SAM-dependent methyltransferase [Candidatus Nitrobium versatile]
MIRRQLKRILQGKVPAFLYRKIAGLKGLAQWPPVGMVRFGDLRNLEPLDRNFGFRRGKPVDRYYIEKFLAIHSEDIRGRVLEIYDNEYTLRFGGSRVTQSDILHKTSGNPKATIVADLTEADHIPAGAFDCIIFINTLQYIYFMEKAVRTLYRILKPQGTLLATLPGISKISREDQPQWGEYWRFTEDSARLLFSPVFSPPDLHQVQTFGNVLSSIAFLHGLAAEDIAPEELDYRDKDYQMIIGVRAKKS